MSVKQQLPDEIMDMISGGVVKVQGETLVSMTSDEDGYYVTTKEGGKYQYLFTEEDKADGMSAVFSRAWFMSDVFQKRDSDETFELKRFTKV